MSFDEYVKNRLKESSDRSEKFWAEVKSRMNESLVGKEEEFSVLDIHDLSDDCVDLIMVRSNGNKGLDQVELWRFSTEKRWLKRPKIRLNIVSGPFLNDFISSRKNSESA